MLPYSILLLSIERNPVHSQESGTMILAEHIQHFARWEGSASS